MKGDRWTPEENRVLLKNLGKISVSEIIRRGLLPGRTVRGTQRHINYWRLNESQARQKRWMPDEDELLRDLYPEHGPSWDGWMRVLPTRSRRAVVTRANKLGMRAQTGWTAEEEELLRKLYTKRAYRGRQWLEVFPGHTLGSIYKKAQHMGLRSPVRGQEWPRAVRDDLRQGVSQLADELGVSESDVSRRVRELMHVFDKGER